MVLSFIGLILIAAIVIGLGFGALWLLSLVINAMTGRRQSYPAAKVGAWSGLKSAVGISSGLVAMIVVLGAVTLVQFRRDTLGARENEQAVFVRTNQAQEEVGRQSTVETFNEATDPEKPAIEIEVKLSDRSIVSVGVDTSEKPTNRSQQSQHASSSVAAAEDPAGTDLAERRKVQLEELVAGIGSFLRSQLEKVGDNTNATAFGQAAKSDNGDVVIFQPSDEMVRQMLGAGGEDLLKSFNSELPGRIRQTYALIPLTPPVGSAVPMQPMIATRGLEMLANSIVSYVEHADAATSSVASDSAALTAEADGALTVAPAIRPEPEWITQTDGRRMVARSKPVMFGDNAEILLTAAINEALAKHVETVTSSMNPAWQNQSKLVHMELPQSMAAKYIVDRYERIETLETEVEGTKSFQVVYALVEFPDAIDQIAVREIRQSIQKDRILGLGIVVGLMWLSVCSAGFGVRQWQKGTKLRRIVATPVFAVITIPTLLLTVAMVFALAKGNVPQGPWNESPVTIDLATMQGV